MSQRVECMNKCVTFPVGQLYPDPRPLEALSFPRLAPSCLSCSSSAYTPLQTLFTHVFSKGPVVIDLII